MEESYGEGPATHTGPESCAVDREVGGEALTGVRAGWAIELRKRCVWGADALDAGGRQHLGRRSRLTVWDPAESKTPSMHGSTSRENWEVPCPPAADGAAGRIGKSADARR